MPVLSRASHFSTAEVRSVFWARHFPESARTSLFREGTGLGFMIPGCEQTPRPERNRQGMPCGGSLPVPLGRVQLAMSTMFAGFANS